MGCARCRLDFAQEFQKKERGVNLSLRRVILRARRNKPAMAGQRRKASHADVLATRGI